MVNLFRLLGLPDPSGVQRARPKGKAKSVDPGPQADDRFHDLGEDAWSERTGRIVPRPDRRVVYLKPDNLHRLALEGAERSLMGGDMLLVDLGSLTHMPSQQDVCRRNVQNMGERIGYPVFSLNNSDTLLMVAGARMRVDTERHNLGMSLWGQLPDSEV
ncbi:MAG: hypothetical protein VX204_02925 [Candidatus Thermoplasmatota archaeon]|nr:hypothetical protein [Candidatus Thermoplasmatota archaeon]